MPLDCLFSELKQSRQIARDRSESSELEEQNKDLLQMSEKLEEVEKRSTSHRFDIDLSVKANMEMLTHSQILTYGAAKAVTYLLLRLKRSSLPLWLEEVGIFATLEVEMELPSRCCLTKPNTPESS